MAAGLSSKLCL